VTSVRRMPVLVIRRRRGYRREPRPRHLVTVFAAAGDGLAHRVSTALTVGTGMLALALVFVVALIVRPRGRPVPSFKKPLVRGVER
jgi:hypothetical protein